MKVLWGCLGRHGDIIAASFLANQLIALGYEVTWLTLLEYKELVQGISPRATIVVAEGEGWVANTSEQLKNYNGYDYYCDVQLGSTANHSSYLGSGELPLDWLRQKVEKQLELRLSANYLAYAILTGSKDVVPLLSPCAIIAPMAITSPALTNELVEIEAAALKMQGYTVYMLRKECTGEVRELCGYSFMDCIYLLQRASIFVGNDSGLAWGSLYSPRCRKRIYHTKERILQVNTWFSRLDSLAEDVLVP